MDAAEACLAYDGLQAGIPAIPSRYHVEIWIIFCGWARWKFLYTLLWNYGWCLWRSEYVLINPVIDKVTHLVVKEEFVSQHRIHCAG